MDLNEEKGIIYELLNLYRTDKEFDETSPEEFEIKLKKQILWKKFYR